MVRRTAYCTSVYDLRTEYDRLLASCRKQKITHLSLVAAITGKLYGTPQEFAYWRDRMLADGLTTWGEVIGNGHPVMGEYYTVAGKPTPDLFWEGELVFPDKVPPHTNLLPRGWQYAVNEFGNPVYCNACPNEACIAGNQWVIRQIAPVFDEIWFDIPGLWIIGVTKRSQRTPLAPPEFVSYPPSDIF